MSKGRIFKCNLAPSGAHLTFCHLLPLVKTRGYLTSPRWGESKDLAPNGAKLGSLGFQPEVMIHTYFCALKGRGRSLLIGYCALFGQTASPYAARWEIVAIRAADIYV